MRLFVIRPAFSRHPLRSMLIGTGILAGIALAAVGAVIGLMLLAAGALVHFALRAVRGTGLPSQTGGSRAAPGIIEGEFRVVTPRTPSSSTLPHAS